MASAKVGVLDVAFLTGLQTADGCDVLHLWIERDFAALRITDDLTLKREISWRDLRGRRFIVSETNLGPEIHDYLTKHLGDLGHPPDVQRQSVGRANLINLVSMGQGLTLTSEATIKWRVPGVVYQPLKDEVLPFSAIWSLQNCKPTLRRVLSLASTMSNTTLPCFLVLLALPGLERSF